MATLHHGTDDQHFIYVKGAPEEILKRCEFQRSQKKGTALIEADYWHRHIEFMAKQGQRMIAIAFKSVSSDYQQLLVEDI